MLLLRFSDKIGPIGPFQVAERMVQPPGMDYLFALVGGSASDLKSAVRVLGPLYLTDFSPSNPLLLLTDSISVRQVLGA